MPEFPWPKAKKYETQNFPGFYSASRSDLYNSVASKNPFVIFYHQAHVWFKEMVSVTKLDKWKVEKSYK